METRLFRHSPARLQPCETRQCFRNQNFQHEDWHNPCRRAHAAPRTLQQLGSSGGTRQTSTPPLFRTAHSTASHSPLTAELRATRADKGAPDPRPPPKAGTRPGPRSAAARAAASGSPREAAAPPAGRGGLRAGAAGRPRAERASRPGPAISGGSGGEARRRTGAEHLTLSPRRTIAPV